MYRTLRRLHRYSAFVALPFLLVYFVSAAQMAHRSWFPLHPARTSQTLTLPKGLTDARLVAQELFRNGAVIGELRYTAVSPAGFRMNIVHPGRQYTISYAPDTGGAVVAITTNGLLGTFTDLHRTAGLAHTDVVMQVWAIAAILASLVLLLLGVTGLYLWFRQTGERRTGVVLIVTSGITIVYLMVSMRL